MTDKEKPSLEELLNQAADDVIKETEEQPLSDRIDRLKKGFKKADDLESSKRRHPAASPNKLTIVSRDDKSEKKSNVIPFPQKPGK